MLKMFFVHGMGLDNRIWAKTVQLLDNVECEFYDLGFIKNNQFSALKVPENAVLVGHSIGFLWILKHLPKSVKHVVSVASVPCFYDYMQKDVLLSMKMGFQNNPEVSIKDFWERIKFKEGFYKANDVNADKMHLALKWLGDWNGREELKQLETAGSGITALASIDDQIVTKSMSENEWKGRDLHFCDDDSHIPQIAKPKWVAEKLQEIIDGLR